MGRRRISQGRQHGRRQHPLPEPRAQTGSQSRQRTEEGTNSLRTELAAIASVLQSASVREDLLYLGDSETALDRIRSWIGRGPKASLVGDANADIMRPIIECLRVRTQQRARTFFVKIKAHRGEPINECADTQAETARQLPEDTQQWTDRTRRMTYEWLDKEVTRTSTWSNAVRNAMRKGAAEWHRKKILRKAAEKWSKEFCKVAETQEGVCLQVHPSLLYLADIIRTAGLSAGRSCVATFCTGTST